MVVDDLEVSDHVAFASGAEADLGLGFPSSLGVNGEVSGSVDLDTCSEIRVRAGASHAVLPDTSAPSAVSSNATPTRFRAGAVLH